MAYHSFTRLHLCKVLAIHALEVYALGRLGPRPLQSPRQDTIPNWATRFRNPEYEECRTLGA
jgi:hypothetical protein